MWQCRRCRLPCAWAHCRVESALNRCCHCCCCSRCAAGRPVHVHCRCLCCVAGRLVHACCSCCAAEDPARAQRAGCCCHTRASWCRCTRCFCVCCCAYCQDQTKVVHACNGWTRARALMVTTRVQRQLHLQHLQQRCHVAQLHPAVVSRCLCQWCSGCWCRWSCCCCG